MNGKRDMETIIRELDARQQIHDCIMRYCRGMDHADPALARSSYHPDATDNHGTYSGPAEGFVDVSMEVVKELDLMLHLICNEYVEFDEADPSIAWSETVTIGSSVTNGSTLDLVVCRYLDRFEERDGRWAIVDRKLVRDWETTVTARGAEDSPATQGMLKGLLSMADPSFSLGFKRWGDGERPEPSNARIGDVDA